MSNCNSLSGLRRNICVFGEEVNGLVEGVNTVADSFFVGIETAVNEYNDIVEDLTECVSKALNPKATLAALEDLTDKVNDVVDKRNGIVDAVSGLVSASRDSANGVVNDLTNFLSFE